MPLRAEKVSGSYFDAHLRAERLRNELNQLMREIDVRKSSFDTGLAEDNARRLVRRTRPRKSTGIMTPRQVRSARESAEDLGGQLASAAGEVGRPVRHRLAGAFQASMEIARLLDSTSAHEVARAAQQRPSRRSRGPRFAVREPVSGRLVARVTPKAFPAILEAPATLEVAAPSHGGVRVPALARLFPAHTVHARRSTAVVTADRCELTSTDHYHVHRMSVSLEPLLRPGSLGNTALRELLKDPSGDAIPRFQQSMERVAGPHERRDTRASLPVQARHRTYVTSAAVVQQGDHSRMTSTTHYVVEESVLPVVDLLARNRHLVRSLVAAATEPEPGPCTSRFLRAAARSAGCAEELVVLGHGRNLRERDTSVYSLFGVDVVDRAAAVMVGSHNRLRTQMEVERGGLRTGRVLADLGLVRKQAVQVRERQPGKTQALEQPGAPRDLSGWLTWDRNRRALEREASPGRDFEAGLG